MRKFDLISALNERPPERGDFCFVPEMHQIGSHSITILEIIHFLMLPLLIGLKTPIIIFVQFRPIGHFASFGWS